LPEVHGYAGQEIVSGTFDLPLDSSRVMGSLEKAQHPSQCLKGPVSIVIHLMAPTLCSLASTACATNSSTVSDRWVRRIQSNAWPYSL
jgi:hypothetical protein